MHDFDAARGAWRRDDPVPPGEPARLLDAARVRLAAMDRAIRRRDRLESAVALVLAPIFAVVAWRTPHLVSAAGATILAAACLFIPVHLRRARRLPGDRGGPLVATVRAELARVHAQERLLRTVLWWYLLPLGLGVLLLVGGAPVSTSFKTIYGALVVAFGGYLYVLNRRAVRADLEPVSRELTEWLADAAKVSQEEDNVH